MEEEIRAEFEGSGFTIGGDSAQILSTLLTYCVNYKLSPADLVSNWEVYYLNRLLSNTHTDEEGFLGTPSMKQEKPPGESSNTELTPLTTERPSSIRAAKTNGDRITPFAQRVNKFTQHYVLNADNVASLPSKDEAETSEDELIRRIPPSQKCTLQVQRSKPEPGCRFMYDRMEDRFNYLEDRIGRSARLFSATGLCGQPADATLASEENMFAVGMVICDGEGRLNEKSILLQGSVEHSRGQRVRLDLKDINQFSLFPGQVVGIEGHNPSGHCFVASKLIDSIPVSVDDQLPCAKKQAVDHEGHQNSNTLSRVLSSVIAAGPFTTTDNLLFEPLQELLSYACRKQPQLLILMGPFIDSDHPEIKKGTSDQSFHDIFHFEILRKLQDFTQYLGHNVRVIFVPSVRDAHHDAVFPQPAFDLHLPEDMTQQITCLSNPSLFSSNEIQFGCCTVDILKQLSGDEISRKPPGGKAADRIGRLATHIVKQQSYYPLYPPAAGVPMDFSLAKEALEIPSAPDVLLLPSDLAPSVKVLSVNEDTEEHKRFICVNPGRLAKGIGGGTFVELYYNEDTEKTKAFIMRI
ncbi:unnamed protein product [Triticum turgidum subsp. durum]|uniref:DNA polymerase alpha subunit B n=1 Tax=Triticum turgidum subsp. durum TaxID=4567 RepID=A0A9R1AB75_TRITD|nr:unnamed protein product [Triticum turgidum subsp. durum]